MPPLDQVALELYVVERLAVIDDPELAAFVTDRLNPVAKADDAQAQVAQSDLVVQIHSRLIRSPVPQWRDHGNDLVQTWRFLSRKVQHSGNSAHRFAPPGVPAGCLHQPDRPLSHRLASCLTEGMGPTVLEMMRQIPARVIGVYQSDSDLSNAPAHLSGYRRIKRGRCPWERIRTAIPPRHGALPPGGRRLSGCHATTSARNSVSSRRSLMPPRRAGSGLQRSDP